MGLLAFIAAAWLLQANAQPTYRCGNTYSQTPCSADAAPVAIHRDVSTAPPGGTADAGGGAVPTGVELCKRAALAGLKDPYSAVIESVTGPVGVAITIAKEPIEARRYTVWVNAKNSYGAYTGAKPHECFLSVDGRRLLQVSGH